jgi:hypothetical protein
MGIADASYLVSRKLRPEDQMSVIKIISNRDFLDLLMKRQSRLMLATAQVSNGAFRHQ